MRGVKLMRPEGGVLTLSWTIVKREGCAVVDHMHVAHSLCLQEEQLLLMTRTHPHRQQCVA